MVDFNILCTRALDGKTSKYPMYLDTQGLKEDMQKMIQKLVYVEEKLVKTFLDEATNYSRIA